MGLAGTKYDFLILTNNPLTAERFSGRKPYALEYLPELDLRGILLKARDYVHLGRELYSHPLAGSVKPNETPYKSLVISQSAHPFSEESEKLISSALDVTDKLKPRDAMYSGSVLRDFQLIDFSLLCAALGLDFAREIETVSKQ